MGFDIDQLKFKLNCLLKDLKGDLFRVIEEITK